MFALLLILPTIAFVPIYFFIFPAIYIVAKKSIEGDFSYLPNNFNKININLLIIVAIIIASSINKWVHWSDKLTILEFLPYTVAILLAYFLAKNLKDKDLKIIVWLIVIEGLVVVTQYFMGINTFIPSLDHFNENIVKNPDLMYNRRPLGLSLNSSVIAYKLLLAYLILDYLKLRNILHNIFRFILLLGIFFTFNRTIFLVFFVYIGFSMIKIYSPIINNLLVKKIRKNQIKYFVLAIVGIVFLSLIVIFSYEDIYAQLTRGRSDGVDFSGRDNIWKGFTEFISENIFFGNGSEKYYLPRGDKLAHAHNSFLQVWATHGVFILGLYLLLVFRNITRKNLIFVILILVYSCFQYGIFWGTSLIDIILFKILFFDSSTSKKKSETST
ncbi:MAG: O-antigen ligase family protein [Brumimicrobium sp.]